MENLLELTIEQAKTLLKSKKMTCLELTSAFIKQIKDTKNLNSIITLNEDNAILSAKEVDKLLNKGIDKPLLGIPIVIKDNISTKGVKTTCASKFLENYIPPYNATVVDKLINAGAIIIGKANLDEFAMGASGENSAYGRTLNPVNTNYVTGGSSSGSASSVASHQCIASLGSDTGGSIRQPAGFCGVVGLKPTYGRVSRYGLIAFASSLDQIGPIAKTAKDCAYVLDVISGYDEKDGTSIKTDNNKFSNTFTNSVKGLKIGIVKEFFEMPMNNEVKENIEKTINFYKNNGVELIDISIPNLDKTLALYYIISSAEASSNLSRFDGIKYGNRSQNCKDIVDVYFKSRTEFFGDEVKRRIMIGNYVLSAGYYDAYYKKATDVQKMIKESFDNAFLKCDAIISPVSPTTAFKFGAKATPLEMYLADIFTVPVNLCGLPAISFPVGKDKIGLPIGCQLIGNKWSEAKLLNMVDFFENNTKGGTK